MKTNTRKQIKSPVKLSLATNNGKELFLPGQIIRLEAKSNYTRIFFTNHISMLTAKVLKDFETLLIPSGFIRTHRSHLVNKQYIQQVCGNSTIIMNDQSIADISKRRKTTVLKALQLFTCRA